MPDSLLRIIGVLEIRSKRISMRGRDECGMKCEGERWRAAEREREREWLTLSDPNFSAVDFFRSRSVVFVAATAPSTLLRFILRYFVCRVE